MYIDFHSHVLPGIDDGSRSVEESVQLLDKMAVEKTKILVATPHFYCSEISIQGFVKRRDEAFKKLEPHLSQQHPRLFFGAEVLYDHAIVRLPDLHDLCIRGTDFLLLEMPYTDLTEEIIEGVDTIINRGDVKLIIAHIERYLNFTSMKNLEKLMQLDVLGQINAVSLKSMKGRSRCMKLIKKGFVHVLGSDMHRTDRDHVPVKQGFEIITKKFDDFDEFALRNGKMILTNESIEKILTL